jgi:hypothetical protein
VRKEDSNCLRNRGTEFVGNYYERQTITVRDKEGSDDIGEQGAEPGDTEPDRNEPTTRSDDPIVTAASNHQPPHRFIPQSPQSAQ